MTDYDALKIDMYYTMSKRNLMFGDGLPEHWSCDEMVVLEAK